MKDVFQFSYFLIVVLVVAVFTSSRIRAESVSEKATQLCKAINGTTLSLDDGDRDAIENFIAQGRMFDAGMICANKRAFMDVTLRNMHQEMFNREKNPHGTLSQGLVFAMYLGWAEEDYRQILTSTQFVRGNNQGGINLGGVSNRSNQHYQRMDRPDYDMTAANALVLVNQNFPDPAGIMSMRDFGESHYIDGTNRRPSQEILKNVLCTDLNEVRTTSTPNDRIRRDVDRAPGGKSSVFLNDCQTCHGGLDPISGAFNYTDWDGDEIRQTPGNVVRKALRGAETFPDGYVDTSDAFQIRWKNAFLQPRAGSVSGNGLGELGLALANTPAFSQCQAIRAFEAACNGTLPKSHWVIGELAQKFEEDNYNLKRLVVHAAVHAECRRVE